MTISINRNSLANLWIEKMQVVNTRFDTHIYNSCFFFPRIAIFICIGKKYQKVNSVFCSYTQFTNILYPHNYGNENRFDMFNYIYIIHTFRSAKLLRKNSYILMYNEGTKRRKKHLKR